MCFGRLDFVDDHDGELRLHRQMGMFDEDNDYEPLLIDWRAPTFGRSTWPPPPHPEGARRGTSALDRRVTGLDDEVLDLDEAHHGRGASARRRGRPAGRAERVRPGGCTTSSRPSRPNRTARPRRPRGVLVVQGGPGTGKTAVARAGPRTCSTHRREADHPWCVIVGPNRRSCATSGRCCRPSGRPCVARPPSVTCSPECRPRATNPPRTAEIKGRVAMVSPRRRPSGTGRVPEEPAPSTSRTVCWSSTRMFDTPAKAPPHRPPQPREAGVRDRDPRCVVELVAQRLESTCSITGEYPLAAATPRGPADLEQPRPRQIRQELGEATVGLLELWPNLTPQELSRPPRLDRRLASAPDRLLAEAEWACCVGPDPLDPADVPLSTRLPNCSVRTTPGPSPPGTQRRGRSPTPRACRSARVPPIDDEIRPGGGPSHETSSTRTGWPNARRPAPSHAGSSAPR